MYKLYVQDKKTNKKNPKNKEEKERKKPKKLTFQCITPTGIKRMVAPLHFHFYINNCQLKLGVTPNIKATLQQELANSMFNETDHLFSL